MHLAVTLKEAPFKVLIVWLAFDRQTEIVREILKSAGERRRYTDGCRWWRVGGHKDASEAEEKSLMLILAPRSQRYRSYRGVSAAFFLEAALIVIHDAAGLSQNLGRLRLKCWIRGECIDHRCWVYRPVEGRRSGWRRALRVCVCVCALGLAKSGRSQVKASTSHLLCFLVRL